MNRPALSIATAALLFAATGASNARAQSAQQAPPAQAAQQAPAPPSAQPSGQDSSTSSSESRPPAKRIWTNENMGELDPHSGVSTVGKKDGSSAGTGPKPAAQNRNAQWYKDKIAQLQAQIPPLDAQIAELQAAIDGKPTGDAKESTRPAGVKFDSWAHELAQFKKKREDLLAQIAALQDEARHHGVSPNAIP